MRPRVMLAFAIAAIVLGSAMLIPAAYAQLNSGDDAEKNAVQAAAEEATTKALSAPGPPTLAPAKVSVEWESGFLSWALLERKSGQISGSRNITATNSTESMIKVWFVSDVLRQSGDSGPSEETLKQASTAIRDSNDDATNALYRRAGGTKSIARMIRMCGLTETKAVIPPGASSVWWSYTSISARDAVRLGECVGNGTAAGPKWTEWVLDEMSKVRGTTAKKDQKARQGGGRWGIIDGLPNEIKSETRVSIKNGWTPINADGMWHINCLAVTDDWVLAVLMRYPIGRGLDHGAQVCASVTRQLVTAQPGAGLKVPLPVEKSS
ncbi:serine hydrolase [Micromonospora sonneratiae]|uniref:Serine hydrolase n=1 Tax=Micromonospora sonneratiae TaxID=1184706 RepID=A0ABW3YGG9_9ACTN